MVILYNNNRFKSTSTNQIIGLINCIPKQDEPFEKNWRSISSFTVVYNIAIDLIAERIETFLENY